MQEQNNTLVIGEGEIGQPLADILGMVYPVETKDIEPRARLDIPVHWMHICFPYSDTFEQNVIDYVGEYDPYYTVIHSTVIPGTTANIQAQVDIPVIYSPVRGRHLYMHRDMMRYTKFVAHSNYHFLDASTRYFEKAHFNVYKVNHTDVLELSKLTETTYAALLIAFAQELERISEDVGVSRLSVLEFTREVEYLPNHVFYPGYIKGHCLMPNIELLLQVRESVLLRAIQASNNDAREWDNDIRYSATKL